MSDRSYTSRFYRDPDSHIADQAFVVGQLKKRIAQLEAEKKTLAWKVAQCTEAAEKTEAEVERLNAENLAQRGHLAEVHGCNCDAEASP